MFCARMNLNNTADDASSESRHSVAQRLQDKLQKRREQNIQSGGGNLGQGGRPQIRPRDAEGVDAASAGDQAGDCGKTQVDADWYDAPEEYTWGGTTASDAGCSYSVRFATGEQRTITKPSRPQPDAGAPPRPPGPPRAAPGSTPGGAHSAPKPNRPPGPRPPPPPSAQRSRGTGEASPRAASQWQPGFGGASPSGSRPSPFRWAGGAGMWGGIPGRPRSACAPGWAPPSSARPPPKPPDPQPRRPQARQTFSPASAANTARTPTDPALAQLEARLQGLRRSSIEEQRRVTKELLEQWHPDKNPGSSEEATRVFQWLQNRRKELLGF